MISSPSLLTSTGHRKYLNASERRRFIATAKRRRSSESLLCLMLLWSGGRLSEILSLRRDHISLEEGVVVFRTLKKRGQICHRHVPLPRSVVVMVTEADDPLFPWGRTQAWSIVKAVMADAKIIGPQATPRGLRHSFAVHAVSKGVPLHLIQRWLGHARLETTAIYSQALGPEERQIARRMWLQN
ncbi:tyrosine-type recombinase/integrase [Tritonibacter mobilis]|uniref:Integrase n=1 Tax=Tritonibacter mobilis F1926 TaxID=1265309 RepID=A0A1B1A165_9RHOB|nr:site-specific integrase [Tritonibacter mobilis]ANP40217.1 integrase [Tritonibacter mobilis F1926]KJZ25411.1 integrase [Tritonibacter mobilis]